MRLSTLQRIVDRLGVVLVYPLPNVPSLWSELYPDARMEWDWSTDADPRIAELWHGRERLAKSSDVAYAKWFRGRATFFSLPVFHALLGRLAAAGDLHGGLPLEALHVLELLRESSPLSTKALRAAADLRGKAQERVYAHAMKELWARLLVVGMGEVADGAFPSLQIAATEAMFEDLFLAREEVPPDADAKLEAALARTPAFRRVLDRTLLTLREER